MSFVVSPAMPTRRQFLGSAAVAALSPALAVAIEPIPRTSKPHLRLSIAAYSYRQYLDLKQKPKPAMTLDDFIDTAAGMDLDAVELTAYYFAETSPAYLAHLKGRCTRLGLDVSGTAISTNFCSADIKKISETKQYVHDWVERSARLGAKTIRIFAGGPDKGESEDKARARCVEGIQEACDFAGKHGIYLALENHGGLTTTCDQILRLV